MIKDINQIVENKRIEIGFRDTEVADWIGLNICWYCDIEWHEDEIGSTVSLGIVKKLFNVLRLDFFTMADIECAFCVLGIDYLSDFDLSRNQLIAKKRNELGVFRDELGDRVNFYEVEIEKMEKDPDHLETWVIDNILLLAEVLAIPPQLLLGVKCENCRR